MIAWPDNQDLRGLANVQTELLSVLLDTSKVLEALVLQLHSYLSKTLQHTA